jgi:hypothetical protein
MSAKLSFRSASSTAQTVTPPRGEGTALDEEL